MTSLPIAPSLPGTRVRPAFSVTLSALVTLTKPQLAFMTVLTAMVAFGTARPAAEASSAIRGAGIFPVTGSSVFATPASRKSSFAPASAAMPASSSAVHEGARGATTTPARSAPMYTAAYSMEVVAQIAIASRGARPSRCKAAATRSSKASSCA